MISIFDEIQTKAQPLEHMQQHKIQQLKYNLLLPDTYPII